MTHEIYLKYFNEYIFFLYQYMGLCVFSLPISHVDCDNMCTLAKNLHHYHQIRHINHYTLLRVRSWNNGTGYVSYYDLAIELVMCMHLMMMSCHVNIFMKMHTKMSSEKWWLFLNLHDCLTLFLIMGILVPSPHGDSWAYFSIEMLSWQWGNSHYKKDCCMTLLSLLWESMRLESLYFNGTLDPFWFTLGMPDHRFLVELMMSLMCMTSCSITWAIFYASGVGVTKDMLINSSPYGYLGYR